MTISEVAVVGAGTMGTGIAQKLASEGLRVVLLDKTREQAADSKTRVEMSLVEGLERGIFDGPEVDAALGRITVGRNLADVGDADLIIEAIDEVLATKRELIAEVSQACRADAILATNTSSLMVSDIAAAASRPDRVVGMHFFYHPAKNRLVEVVGHADTDPDVLRAACALQDRMGKTVILSADSPGFLVNRFFAAWLNEAVRLHEEGITTASIEAAACQAFGVKLGPFALMNNTGVSVAASGQCALAAALGVFYEPADLLVEQAANKRTWNVGGKPDPSQFGAIADRLWGAVFHVVCELLSANVGSAADIDVGARVGLRWARGPVETMNTLGLERVAELAGVVEQKYEGTQPEALAEQLRAGGKFAIERVRVSVDDGIATLTLNRPDKLNALDLDTLEQLGRCFDQVSARDDVRALVIAGAGKAFATGPDVGELADDLRSDRGAEPVLEYARQGQALLRRIEKSGKPVICRLDGAAVGSGAELALACHVIVATPRARMAFPETGWGIHPMLGGTQRLSQRVGRGLARYFLFTGKEVDADTLAALKLAWRVTPPDEIAAAVTSAIAEAPKQEACPVDQAPPALRDLGRFLAAVPAEGLIDGSLTLPGGTDIMEVARAIRKKAPQAVRAVATLTELAEEGDLDAGLAAEAEGLRALLETRDAVEGLTAAAEQRKAEFGGS